MGALASRGQGRDDRVTGGGSRAAPTRPGTDAVAHAGGDLWDAYLPDLTPAKLQRAHELGIKLSVWGIGAHQEFVQLIDAGIDYITTIRPDRFVSPSASARGQRK